jgi:hypothetical protein
MGQQEVLDFLRKHPDKWYTSKEIEKALKCHVISRMPSLRKSGFVQFKNEYVSGNMKFLYKYREDD